MNEYLTALFSSVRSLIAVGLSPIPLCEPRANGGCTAAWHEFPCAKAGKRPLISGFPEYVVSPPSAELIIGLFQRHLPCNVGIVVPEKMVVIDADSPSAEEEVLATGGGAFETPSRERRPGRGRTWLFQTEKTVKSSAHLGDSGAIDLVGPGGLWVVPPSINRTGHRYEWVVGREPWTVQVQLIPTGLESLLEEVEADENTSTEVQASPTLSSLSKRVQRLLEGRSVLKKLWNGQGKTRGDQSESGYDFALAVELLRLGISPAEVAAVIACRPGAHRRDQRYCETTVKNASKSIGGVR